MSLRAAVIAVFLAYGVAAGCFAGSIPAILAQSGTSKETFGVILTLNTLAYVVTMWWGSRHLDRISPRTALLISLPLHALAQCVNLLSHNSAMLLAGMLLISLGAGATDLAMNAEGAGLERRSGRPMLAKFHGLTSATIAIGAIVGSIAAGTVGTWPSAVLVAVVFAGVWILVRQLPRESAGRAATAGAGFRPSRPAVLLGLMTGLAMCGEVAAFMWSAKALSEMAPALLIFAGAGVAFFSTCHATGRFLADGLRSRLGDMRLLIASIALAALGLAIVAVSHSFTLSLLGFALTGLGSAAVVPIAFALSTGLDPEARAAGLGFVSLVAGVPRVIFPFLFGYLAEYHSNGSAFGLASLGLAAALVLAIVYARDAATGASFRSLGTSRADGT